MTQVKVSDGTTWNLPLPANLIKQPMDVVMGENNLTLYVASAQTGTVVRLVMDGSYSSVATGEAVCESKCGRALLVDGADSQV